MFKNMNFTIESVIFKEFNVVITRYSVIFSDS